MIRAFKNLNFLAICGASLGMASMALAASRAPESDTGSALDASLGSIVRPERLLGFGAASEKGLKGFENILSGQILGNPMPLWLIPRSKALRSFQERWRTEGVIPSPFARSEDYTVGLGEAVFTGDKGVRLVTKTCFDCHAGTAAGYIIAGMGNSHMDVVPLVKEAQAMLRWDPETYVDTSFSWKQYLSRLLGRLVPGQLRAFHRYFRDYRNYVREFVLPPYLNAEGRGDNLGPYAVWLMMAKIADPERTGIIPGSRSDPRTQSERDLLATVRYFTVDPNPWWSARFKARAYWFWDSPGHNARDFHLNFYGPQAHIDSEDSFPAHREKFEKHLAMIDEVMHYVKEVEPPALPPTEESRLAGRSESVQRGEEIFHGGANSTGKAMHCAGCHGTYHHTDAGIDVRYSNVGLIDVGTDPGYNSLMQLLTPLIERAARTSQAYDPGHAPDYHPIDKPGYPPPVLVSLWASAPYLHNGAVPTLRDLLEAPAKRPLIWGHDLEHPEAYDFDKLGLIYDKVDTYGLETKRRAAAPHDAYHPDQVEFRRFYDTRRPGKSNGGHLFGTDLNAEEKQALVDFLESLAPTAAKPVVNDLTRTP